MDEERVKLNSGRERDLVKLHMRECQAVHLQVMELLEAERRAFAVERAEMHECFLQLEAELEEATMRREIACLRGQMGGEARVSRRVIALETELREVKEQRRQEHTRAQQMHQSSALLSSELAECQSGTEPSEGGPPSAEDAPLPTDLVLLPDEEDSDFSKDQEDLDCVPLPPPYEEEQSSSPSLLVKRVIIDGEDIRHNYKRSYFYSDRPIWDALTEVARFYQVLGSHPTIVVAESTWNRAPRTLPRELQQPQASFVVVPFEIVRQKVVERSRRYSALFVECWIFPEHDWGEEETWIWLQSLGKIFQVPYLFDPLGKYIPFTIGLG